MGYASLEILNQKPGNHEVGYQLWRGNDDFPAERRPMGRQRESGDGSQGIRHCGCRADQQGSSEYRERLVRHVNHGARCDGLTGRRKNEIAGNQKHRQRGSRRTTEIGEAERNPGSGQYEQQRTIEQPSAAGQRRKPEKMIQWDLMGGQVGA